MKPSEEIIKTITQKILDSFCLEGKITEKHAVQIKLILAKFIRENVKQILEKLELIKIWPEPSPDAGQGGPGPLWTSGLLCQYTNDREKHEKQIQEIIDFINNENI